MQEKSKKRPISEDTLECSNFKLHQMKMSNENDLDFWSEEQDMFILKLINDFGNRAWRLTKAIFNKKFNENKKIVKSLRNRYNLLMKNSTNKSPWTEEEETILFDNQKIQGNKWSLFTKLFPGRSENSIKNHFYSLYRKRIRKILKFIKKNLDRIFYSEKGKEIFSSVNFQTIYKNLRINKAQYCEINLKKILIIILHEKNIPEQDLLSYISHKISSIFDFNDYNIEYNAENVCLSLENCYSPKNFIDSSNDSNSKINSEYSSYSCKPSQSNISNNNDNDVNSNSNTTGENKPSKNMQQIGEQEAKVTIQNINFFNNFHFHNSNKLNPLCCSNYNAKTESNNIIPIWCNDKPKGLDFHNKPNLQFISTDDKNSLHFEKNTNNEIKSIQYNYDIDLTLTDED